MKNLRSVCPQFVIWLLPKLKFLIPMVDFAPPPTLVVSKVTAMLKCIYTNFLYKTLEAENRKWDDGVYHYIFF